MMMTVMKEEEGGEAGIHSHSTNLGRRFAPALEEWDGKLFLSLSQTSKSYITGVETSEKIQG